MICIRIVLELKTMQLMAKKRLRKATDKEKVKEPAANPPPVEEKAMDFGGLPQRDIKKNLGCG